MDILTIKNKIKEFIKLVYTCPDYGKTLLRLKDDKLPKIVLFGTPVHGNLGDQAIAISELDFLKKWAGDRNIVEIPMPLYKTYRKTIKKYINPVDTIVISGGGWMGNLWLHNEITIREIVLDYLKNRVVIFPQTLYYTDDESGEKTFKETKAVFAQHEDLVLSVRDRNSFNCAQVKLGLRDGKNLLFCPDMVLYGTLAQKTLNLQGDKIALLCLRNDLEKKHDNCGVKEIVLQAGYVIHETTTVLTKLIPMRKRVQVVMDKISEFKSATVVITDRLHAMLFAQLSGTPCIAFDNITGKVFGVGEYLKGSDMQLFLTDKIDKSMMEALDLKKVEYVLTDEFNFYFFSLACKINSEGRS